MLVVEQQMLVNTRYSKRAYMWFNEGSRVIFPVFQINKWINNITQLPHLRQVRNLWCLPHSQTHTLWPLPLSRTRNLWRLASLPRTRDDESEKLVDEANVWSRTTWCHSSVAKLPIRTTCLLQDLAIAGGILTSHPLNSFLSSSLPTHTCIHPIMEIICLH